MKDSSRIFSVPVEYVCGLFLRAYLVSLALLLVTGCVPRTDPPLENLQPAPASTMMPAPISSPTHTPPPSPTAVQSLAESPAPEETSLPLVCSPLEGISLGELAEMISNPFNPPRPGSDDPHQGIDLADINLDNVAVGGRPVSVVLNGRVAAVIRDRFPYGNALLVETTLESLPTGWIEGLDLPDPGVLAEIPTVLTCPALPDEPAWDLTTMSLYLLYAHLQSPPELHVGEEMECGQIIGAIGSSGNALNPHLHLEVRSGPAGASFDSMAHYDASASLDEMAAYCSWRVSGNFPLVNPMSLFSPVP
jgi:murein DD-endopeptidase MepM/ murein hydrolase activator NlpD